jgi:hypothetical protein
MMKKSDEAELEQDLRNGLFLLVMAVVLLNPGQSLPAFWGANLLIMAGLVKLVTYLWQHYVLLNRNDPSAICDFLIAERQWILKRLRIMTQTENISITLIVFGCALWLMSLGYFRNHWFLAVVGGVAFFAALEGIHYFMVFKPLNKRLEGINQRIACCHTNTV